MDNIIIGVMRAAEGRNDVLIPKNVSDELLGDMYADLTMVLNKVHPGALEVATKILEGIQYE